MFKIKLFKSIDNAIKNLTHQPTKYMGTTLADVWYIVFGGISQIADKRKIKYSIELEKYRQELEGSVSLIPDDKRIEPSIQVTAVALENSKYCVEIPILRRMFAALIANSMNSDYSDMAHPAFAETIKQLSVLDAAVIRMFKMRDDNNIPVCRYVRAGKNGAYHVLAHHLFIPDTIDLEISSFKYAESLTSLERLGLVTVDYDIQINDDSVYDILLDNSLLQAFKNDYPEHEIVVHKGVATLSLFGYSFVQVCISD